jgi:hypothetical protein
MRRMPGAEQRLDITAERDEYFGEHETAQGLFVFQQIQGGQQIGEVAGRAGV